MPVVLLVVVVVFQTHPLLSCAETVARALDAVADLDPTFLPAADKRTVLLELTSAISRLEELQLRVLAAGQSLGDVAEADGARDAAAWLSHHARLDPGRARHLARLAVALQERYAAVATALRGGHLGLAQADVIIRALDALPEDLDDTDPGVRRLAEERLVAEAATFGPRGLRILGRRILEVVAPEVAEHHEKQALADEDARAAALTYLRTRRRGDGTTDLRGRLADAVVDRLLRYLHAFTSPRQAGQPARGPAEKADARGSADTGTGTAGDRRPYDRKLAHALGALLESWDPDRLPLHGGDATTVMVTVELADLQDQLTASGVAHLGDQPVTAAHARRLACTAQILPAVLGGMSQVLDLGRSRRLFTPGQRKALALHHPTCAADGCDIPAPWCEAHHAGQPWSHGGRTDLTDGTLLCSHHHHRAHDPRYTTTRHPDHTITFHRRQ